MASGPWTQRYLALAVALGAAAVVAGVAQWLTAEYLPKGMPLPGTRVAGHAVPEDEPAELWLERLGDRLGASPVFVDTGDAKVETTLARLGFALDLEATAQALRAHAGRGSLIERMRRALRARRGAERVAPRWALDRVRARSYLDEIGPALARIPEEARVDLQGHRKIPDVSGRELDLVRSLHTLQGLVGVAFDTVPLVFREIPAKIRLDDLVPVDVSQVLATFETDFAGKAGRRKVNIERAVHYLNGTVIEPGDLFSFNHTVGVRTLGRGFVEAPVIIDDVMEPGIGGGVCQVASTLFATAIHGNLEIVRRRSHSRPSGYTPLGLDAVVIDHEVDLRMRNPYDVPLLIHAYLPTETTIRVELLGRRLDQEIEHRYSVTERQDFVRRVKFTPEVKEPKRKQKGNYGYDVVSVISVKDASGKTRRRSYPSKYYPVPEVFWVPPGYDLALLPPLPEGATETVVGEAEPELWAPGLDMEALAEPPS